MNDDQHPPRASRRRASARATTIKVTIASLAAAAALTGGLAAQMAAGRDPALGSGQRTSESAKPPEAHPAQSGSTVTNQPPPASVVTRAS